MTLNDVDVAREGRQTSEALDVLAKALKTVTLPADRRVLAASNSRSTDEGLALLAAYVAIEDLCIRQAILDTVIAVSSPR